MRNWKVEGYPSKEVAELMDGISNPSTNPTIRKALFESLQRHLAGLLTHRHQNQEDDESHQRMMIIDNSQAQAQAQAQERSNRKDNRNIPNNHNNDEEEGDVIEKGRNLRRKRSQEDQQPIASRKRRVLYQDPSDSSPSYEDDDYDGSIQTILATKGETGLSKSIHEKDSKKLSSTRVTNNEGPGPDIVASGSSYVFPSEESKEEDSEEEYIDDVRGDDKEAEEVSRKIDKRLQYDDKAWHDQYEQLKAYRIQHGHCNVPRTKGSLGMWVKRQRFFFSKKKMREDRKKLLDKIGFVWRIRQKKQDVTFFDPNDIQKGNMIEPRTHNGNVPCGGK